MHDSISFEQLGKPGLAVCTTPFEANLSNLARVMGLPDFPFILVDHPIGSRTIDEIRERARQAYAQALAILSGQYASGRHAGPAGDEFP